LRKLWARAAGRLVAKTTLTGTNHC